LSKWFNLAELSVNFIGKQPAVNNGCAGGQKKIASSTFGLSAMPGTIPLRETTRRSNLISINTVQENNMCQMNVLLEKEGGDELLMEGASLLESKGDGVELSSLFDPPRLIPGVRVVRIDFLNGKVILGKAAGGAQ